MSKRKCLGHINYIYKLNVIKTVDLYCSAGRNGHKRMRIVQINSYSNGSTGQIAASIHSALLNSNNDSLFAYGSGPEIVDGGYRISNRLDIFVHTLLTLFTGLHGYSSVHVTRRLIKKLKKFNPDLIHLHNLHGGYLNLKILFDYLKKANISVVLTIHDCWIYTGKCYHYYEAKCDKYLNRCGNCPQLSMYPKSFLFDCTSKMLMDKRKWIEPIEKINIVTISDWLKHEVKNSFLGTYPITTIKNGINSIYDIIPVPDDVQIKYGIKDKFVILGVASSWNSHKGISDFVRLANKLSNDEVIVLVGNMAKNIELPKNIIAINHTESMHELALIYNSASVYVSMSTEETFGLTIAEALSCGTPAVVYQATACPEMIVEGENGYVASPHNIAQVYNYIQLIKKGKIGDRESISLKARRTYSQERMVAEYLSYYRSILG